MINPYKKIKELEKSNIALAKELHSRNLVIKELKELPNTSIHPKYKTLIQEVKEIKGRKLYEFKDLIDMPSNRYNHFDKFSLEFSMRLDLATSIDLDKKINEVAFEIGKLDKISYAGCARDNIDSSRPPGEYILYRKIIFKKMFQGV